MVERILIIENDPQKKMDILIELTDLILSSDTDRALDYANKTVTLAEEYNNQEKKLRAWLQLSQIYVNKADLRSSLEFGNKAKALATDLNLDKEYAESLILMARNFSFLGDYEKSANYNFQALDIFEELDYKKGIGNTYNRIGYDYFEQDNYDKALDYYTRSLKICKEINDLDGISRGLNNVAIVYANKEDYQHVKKNILESIEINKSLDRQLWEGVNYLNLGNLFRTEENYDTAFIFLNKAVDIFTHLNSPDKLSKVYYGLSLYYFDLDKQDSSLYYADLTYNLGRENNIKKTIFDGSNQMRKIYEKQNDFVNAYKYSIIEGQLKDSLDTENSMTKISNQELLHEFEKAEQENKLKQKHREFILVLIGVAIVFILIGLVIFIVMRNRLKAKNEEIERRRLNLELETRNRELAANVMTLIRKNEILSGIGDKLINIQNDAVKEETKYAIKKIARELQQSTSDETWDEFEVRFNQVHGEFYNKLRKNFPNLTPNEHRLCAFLRLNMSTKEISELTGQRTDTLEVARWRLRKKLNINNTKVNLVTFLSNI